MQFRLSPFQTRYLYNEWKTLINVVDVPSIRLQIVQVSLTTNQVVKNGSPATKPRRLHPCLQFFILRAPSTDVSSGRLLLSRSPGRRKVSLFDEETFECARGNVPQRYMRNCYQVHLHRINAQAKLLHSHANGPIVKYSCRLIGLHGITPGVCNKIIICRPRCIFRRLLIVYRIWLISILDARRSIDY